MNDSSILLLDQVSKIGVVKKSRSQGIARFKAEAVKIGDYPDANCKNQILTVAAVAAVVLSRNLGMLVADVLRIVEDQNVSLVRFRIDFKMELNQLRAAAVAGNYWGFLERTHRIIACPDTFAAQASTRFLPPALPARPRVIPLP